MKYLWIVLFLVGCRTESPLGKTSGYFVISSDLRINMFCESAYVYDARIRGDNCRDLSCIFAGDSRVLISSITMSDGLFMKTEDFDTSAMICGSKK